MSSHAKSVIAALAAVVITGIQAWQLATVDGFRPVDLLPVATAVVGAVLTRVVPNVPELPAAKAWVGGALAILTALSTFAGDHPAGITAASLLTVAAGAFLTWFVPELAPAPLGPDGVPNISSLAHPAGQEITDALADLDRQPAPAPATNVEPVTQPLPPAVQPAPEPTPIGDAAASAARAITTDTVAMAAVPAAPAA